MCVQVVDAQLGYCNENHAAAGTLKDLQKFCQNLLLARERLEGDGVHSII